MSNDTNNTLVHKKEEVGYSYADEYSIVYKWKINKITSFLEAARKEENDFCFLVSPEFSTGAKINDSWYLKIKIKNDDDESKSKWLSIYLHFKVKYLKTRTKYFLFILNRKGEKIVCNNEVYSDSSNCWSDRIFDGSNYSSWGYNRFVEIDEILEDKYELLQNDTLTVGVDLIVYDDYVPVNSSNNLLQGTKRKMSNDYEDLFETKQKCDVTIKVGEEKLDAHKLILITRSSVFNAMFSYDMKENKENEITIPDIDPEVFKKVLKYIYTDKVDDLISFAEELLEAADKYQLLGLKELCECSLSKTLTPTNAVRILILADRHSAKRLKEVTIDFIANNWVKFENTEQFKQLEKAQVSLAYAVVRKAFDGVKKNNGLNS